MSEKLLREGSEKLAEKGMVIAGLGSQAGNSQKLTRDYLDSLQIEWRVMEPVTATTKVTLFKQEFRTPITTAALSGLNTIVPNGAVDMAKGAAEAGAMLWTGIGDEDELRSIIDTGAKVVKIVKPYRDNDLIHDKIAQAERHGAVAVGMDVDFFYGRKDGSAPVPMGPKSLAEMERFVKSTKLPFVLKGILSETDAHKALNIGAAGIVVSHHGGAVMDSAVPPLRILPKIAKLTAGRIPAFVDCGITRGLDAFKAFALGANGVSVGKALIAALVAGGADGVRQVIEDMTAELERALCFTGSPDIGSIPPAIVWSRFAKPE